MRDKQLAASLETLTGFTSGLISQDKPNVTSSLPDVLETGPHLSKYFLSPRAATGILRRAAKRGRELPPHLAEALSRLSREADGEATG